VEFYKKELPPVISLLNKNTKPIKLIFIDGYVWLGSKERFRCPVVYFYFWQNLYGVNRIPDLIKKTDSLTKTKS
jgi:hypothetical protein